MESQDNSWCCSVCSFQWVIQSTQTDPDFTYDQALETIGYPDCVNPTYGLMSAQCMIDAFSKMGWDSKQAWVTFEQAYSIMEKTTGTISLNGMYHVMAIRGALDGYLWVANSAPGYMGVWDVVSKETFNNYGPCSITYLEV